MGAAAMKVLAVGGASPHTRAVLERLARRGWVSFPAETLREARTMIEAFEYDAALCAENLADGKGYDLLNDAKRRRMALFVGLELSGASLWLPVVDRGGSVIFGERAVAADALEAKLEEILAAGERKRAKQAVRPAAPGVESSLAAGTEIARRRRGAETGGVPGAMAPVPPPTVGISSDEAGRLPEPAA